MVKVLGYLSLFLIVFILSTDALILEPLITVIILLVLSVTMYVCNEKGAFDDLK